MFRVNIKLAPARHPGSSILHPGVARAFIPRQRLMQRRGEANDYVVRV